MRDRFHSIYSHGFIRAAVCIPWLRVADPAFNLERTLHLARQASEANAAVALFPEDKPRAVFYFAVVKSEEAR